MCNSKENILWCIYSLEVTMYRCNKNANYCVSLKLCVSELQKYTETLLHSCPELLLIALNHSPRFRVKRWATSTLIRFLSYILQQECKPFQNISTTYKMVLFPQSIMPCSNMNDCFWTAIWIIHAETILRTRVPQSISGIMKLGDQVSTSSSKLRLSALSACPNRLWFQPSFQSTWHRGCLSGG